jgi:hypothetical protein
LGHLIFSIKCSMDVLHHFFGGFFLWFRPGKNTQKYCYWLFFLSFEIEKKAQNSGFGGLDAVFSML